MARAKELVWSTEFNIAFASAATNQDEAAKMGFYTLWKKLIEFGWEFRRGCLGNNSSNLVVTADPLSSWTDVYTDSARGTWGVFSSPIGLVAGLDGSYLGEQSRLHILLFSSDYYYIANISISRNLFTGGSYQARPTATYKIMDNQSFGDFQYNYTVKKLYFWVSPKGGLRIRGNDTATRNSFYDCLEIMDLQNVVHINSLSRDHPFAVYIRAHVVASVDTESNFIKPVTEALSTGGIKSWDVNGNVMGVELSREAHYSGTIGYGMSVLGDVNGNILDSACWIVSLSSTYRCRMGRIADMYVSKSFTSGAIDNQLDPQWEASGNLLFPINNNILFGF